MGRNFHLASKVQDSVPRRALALIDLTAALKWNGCNPEGGSSSSVSSQKQPNKVKRLSRISHACSTGCSPASSLPGVSGFPKPKPAPGAALFSLSSTFFFFFSFSSILLRRSWYSWKSVEVQTRTLVNQSLTFVTCSLISCGVCARVRVRACVRA